MDLENPPIPLEHLPKPRRSVGEWLHDLVFPPTPWELEGRYLRLQIAERVRIRTELQDRRTRAMEARRLEREASEKERLDGAVQHGTWTVGFNHAGVQYIAVVALEELVNRQGLRELTVKSLKRSDGSVYHVQPPSAEDLRQHIQADQRYTRFARPWKDGQLSTKSLRKLKPVGFTFPELSTQEELPVKNTKLRAEVNSLKKERGILWAALNVLNLRPEKDGVERRARSLATKLRGYEHSRGMLEYIASWERENGTVAAIMPTEIAAFVAGLQQAAVRSSARASVDELEKECEPYIYAEESLELQDIEGTIRKIRLKRPVVHETVASASAILQRMSALQSSRDNTADYSDEEDSEEIF